MSRIGIWGDSITWGACDYEMGGGVNRLRFYIDNNCGGESDIYNLGVSGDKVADVLKRFDVECEARHPDIIILAIGINDSPHSSHPDGTMLKEFEQQFSELVAKAGSKSSKLLTVGLTRVDDNHPKNKGYKNDTIKSYDELVKKVAKNNQLSYIDVFDVITLNDLKLDGLHPEAEGHEKIFQKVKEALEV